ncbi:MAG: hypothetical protein LBI68_05105 [Azoarcus sp.]|nr:hypothetical protein [Azoarcus sp.]
MTEKTLPAAAGWQWWQSAFGLLLRAPKSVLLYPMLFALFFCAIFLVLSFVLALLAPSMPVVAVLVVVLVMLATGMLSPALMLGLMSIFRSADQGESPSMAAFMQPFRERLLPLVAAGLLIAGFSIIVQFVVTAISGLGIDGLLAMYTYTDDIYDISSTETLAGMGLLPLLLSLLVTTVSMMLVWYSYFLVGWHDRPVISALKESFTAALKNWAPFLVCFLVYFVGAIVVAIVLSVLAVILVWILPKWILFLIGIVGVIVFAAVVMALLYGVWYYSYKTVFGEQEPTPK